MGKEITVCSDCETPLVFTFCFAGAEYYCLNCGNATGMMGGGDRVKSTPELRAKAKVVKDLWKAIYKSFLPRSSYRKRNCKKCTGTNHYDHLSKQEILRNKFATKALEALEGSLS